MIVWLNNSNLKKIISIITCLNLLFVIFNNDKIYSENKVLTVAQAVNYAQNLSRNYKNKKNLRATKKIELMQAREAISDIRKKESTIRFSLLFNIKLPEKHAMPKEIDLLMKVPKIETEIKNITKELEDIRLADKEKTETCFLDVYGYEQKYKMAKEILDEMNKKSKKMKIDLAIGEANEKDLISLQNNIKTQETKIAGLLQNLERYKEKLSELIGFDVTGNYIFKNPMQKIDIDRSYLENLTNYSLNNDVSVNKTRNEEYIARRNVDEIYGVYNKKWGGIIRRIESDVKKDSDIDFDQFIDKYNNLLRDIDKPWTGYYKINLLFFNINIPKEWLKKEYDGLRYFEDQKYAIFVALKEKEDAVNNRKSAEKELKTNIQDGYEMLKELWRVYNSSVELSNIAKKAYDSAYVSNKLGKTSFDDVEMEKTNFEMAQETEFDNLLAYNKQLISYDKLTCGAITSLRNSVDVFLKSAQTGDSILEFEELLGNGNNASDKIMYYINQVVDQKKIVFGLQVPEGYPDKITHYEVLTPEKVIITAKTGISESVAALPIEYKGSTELLVRLYNDDKFVAEGSFDAIVTRGQLNLQKTDQNKNYKLAGENDEDIIDQKVTVGSYNITGFIGNYIKKIQFNIPATQGISFYKIVNENQNEIGNKDKYYSITETFSYLGFALNDLSKLKVNLYDANYKLKFVAEFDELNNEIKY